MRRNPVIIVVAFALSLSCLTSAGRAAGALAIADGGETYDIEGADSVDAAQAKALAACAELTKSPCSIAGAYQEQCVAIALDDASAAGWSFASSAKGAADAAIAQCKQKPGAVVKACKVSSLHCDFRGTAQAISAYGDITRILPKKVSAWRIRCYLRAAAGDFNNALKDCNEAMRLGAPDYGLAVTLETRGIVHLKLKKFDDAIDDFTAALRFDAKRAVALYGRGLAKAEKGQSGDADIAAAKALDVRVIEDFLRPGAAGGRP